MFVSNGILFNHESEVRGSEFVTGGYPVRRQGYTMAQRNQLYGGNISAVKDWGYTRVYVEGMWTMFQQNYPDDFVLGTGESHTVREFAETAFKEIDMDIERIGSGMNEVGLSEGMTRLEVSRELYRPLESDNFRADCSKAKKTWGGSQKPTSGIC